MKPVTFRVIKFPKLNKYIAVAWNYDEAVLISTKPHNTYLEARVELNSTVVELNVELKWFDGEYEYNSSSGCLLPLA